MLRRTQNLIFGYFYKPSNFYSVEYIIYLYEQLCRNQIVDNSNLDLLVNIFRELPEILVWADKHEKTQSGILGTFREKNMALFFVLYLHQHCACPLVYQIYQALNIIFENINRECVLELFLNDNIINYILTNPLYLKFDEILCYYISCIKLLAMKISAHNLKMFVNFSDNPRDIPRSFPIITESLRFFNHKDSMIVVNVRSILLILLKKGAENFVAQKIIPENILAGKINTDNICGEIICAGNNNIDKNFSGNEINKYFLKYISCHFFSHLIFNLKKCIDTLNNNIDNNENNYSLNNITNDFLDQLQFISDILNVSTEEISNILIYLIIKNFIDPLRILNLNNYHNNNDVCNNIKIKNLPFITAFVFSQIFQLIIHPYLRKYIIIEYLFNINYDLNSNITFTEPIPLETFFINNNIGVTKYNITERLKKFLTSIYFETMIKGYNVNETIVSNNNLNKNLNDNDVKYCNHENHELPIISTNIDFKNFSILKTFSDIKDERSVYFQLNFLLQLYNYINEEVFLEIFDNDIDNFILYQLLSFIDLIKFYMVSNNNDCNGVKIRPALIFEAFFLYFTLINKFKSTMKVIANSSILSDLINLLGCIRSIVEGYQSCVPLQDNCLITQFFYCIREFEYIIISPELFSNCYQMFLSSDSSTDGYQKKLPKFLQSANINIFIKFFTYLNLKRCIEIVDHETQMPITNELSQLTHQYYRTLNSIHSSDFEIISCFIITLNEYIHGFMTFTDSHVILAKPAPSPHYGSLNVVHYFLYNTISIYPNRDTDSFIISITILETMKNSKPHSDLIIKLKFISDDTAKMIYEKLHDRIQQFNKRIVDLLYKLDVKIENSREVFPSDKNHDYDTIKNKHFPVNITQNSEIIADVVQQYEQQR